MIFIIYNITAIRGHVNVNLRSSIVNTLTVLWAYEYSALYISENIA